LKTSPNAPCITMYVITFVKHHTKLNDKLCMKMTEDGIVVHIIQTYFELIVETIKHTNVAILIYNC
jgi:hypothetical protein